MATTESERKERRRAKPPKMGRHSSGQARVTLGGKVLHLGLRGSAEAHENYARLDSSRAAAEAKVARIRASDFA